MSKTTGELCEIASYGGGMILESSSKTTEQFCKIASQLKRNAHLVIKNAGHKSTESLCQIASYGEEGSVIFVIG